MLYHGLKPLLVLLGMIPWQQLLILRIITLKRNLLRFPRPWFPVFCFTLTGLLQLTSFTNLFLSPFSLFDNNSWFVFSCRTFKILLLVLSLLQVSINTLTSTITSTITPKVTSTTIKCSKSISRFVFFSFDKLRRK